MVQSKNLFKKIGVFYDGNFLLHTSNYYNYAHKQHSRLSIAGLHRFIEDRVSALESVDKRLCKIVESHYFRGRLNAAEASQRGSQLYNDRVFDDILMSEGIHTHYLPLRNLFGRREERGVDVWLSLEVYELALSGKLDFIVLVVSDTDYVPLVRKLNTLGIPIMLLSWEFEYKNEDSCKIITKTSHELLQLTDYPVLMHEEIESGLAANDPIVNDLFVSGEAVAAKETSVNTGEVQVSEVLSLKNGYGFIKYPNNNLFFHFQDVLGDSSELSINDPVEFTLDKGSSGQDIAKNVKRIIAEQYELRKKLECSDAFEEDQALF